MPRYLTHAGFDGLVDVKLSIVRLGHVPAFELGLVSGIGPRLVWPSWWGGIGRGHLDSRATPEPSVDDCRLQVVAVAALEVAETSAGPNVCEVLCNIL